MPRYDDDELQVIIEHAISRAQNYDVDDSQDNKEQALKYYLGKARGDEITGRSQQQSMDVSDMVNAAMAQLVPMLSTDADAFVQFEPMGQEDEQAAEAESLAVNKKIMHDNNGYTLLIQVIKDALIMRNGVIKVDMSEREESRTMQFTDVDEEVVASFLIDKPSNEEREIIDIDDRDYKVRITVTTREFNCKAIDPRNFLYEREWDELEIQDIPFCAERDYKTRSELVDMGIDKQVVAELPTNQEQYRGKHVRRQYGSQPESYVRENDRIEVYECYLLLDHENNDGIAERYKAIWTNNRLLSFEPYPWVPYAIGTAMIYPHDVEGESMYDRIKSVQDVKTHVLRNWNDNLTAANFARVGAVNDQVNLDDLTNPRPGGVVRLRNPDAIVPLPAIDIGPSAMQALEYQDKLRMERGGASLDMQAGEAQIVGESYAGIERQFSSKELTVQAMAATLGQTLIRPMFLLMHNALRLWSNEPIMMKVAGNWQEIDPSAWPERNQVSVIVGQTVGQRNASNQALLMFVNMAQQAMMNGLGGQIVDLGGVYKAMNDWLRSSGVDTPQQYLIDPASPEAQQAAQAQQQQQQQMEQMQQQMMQMQVELDKYKHDTELQFKYFDAALDADTKEGVQLSQVMVEAEKLSQGAIDNERNRAAQAESGRADNRKAN